MDRFEAVKLKNLRAFKLRGVVTVVLFGSLSAVILYDCLATYFKYYEGWRVKEESGDIVPQSKKNYHPDNVELLAPTDAFWSITCTLKSSGMFLMNSMWHNLSRKIINAKFMSSIEFKAYGVYSVLSLILYPFFQLLFLNSNPLMSAVMPQFVYHAECFSLIIITQISNKRFRRILENLPPTSPNRGSLRFFIHMNNWLTLMLALDFIGLFAINADVCTTERVVYNSMFLTDFFSRIFNLGFCFEYPVLFLILYPMSSMWEGADKDAQKKQERMTRQAASKLAKSRAGGSAGELASSRKSTLALAAGQESKNELLAAPAEKPQPEIDGLKSQIEALQRQLKLAADAGSSSDEVKLDVVVHASANREVEVLA